MLLLFSITLFSNLSILSNSSYGSFLDKDFFVVDGFFLAELLGSLVVDFFALLFVAEEVVDFLRPLLFRTSGSLVLIILCSPLIKLLNSGEQ